MINVKKLLVLNFKFQPPMPNLIPEKAKDFHSYDQI